MFKSRKKINYRLVKFRRTYTAAELSELFGKHIRTIQDWKKSGLKPIEERTSPLLYLGEDVISFLKSKKKKKSFKLADGEFNCLKCGKPRKSNPESINFLKTESRMGNQNQMIIKGKCIECGGKINLFSTENKVNELITNGLLRNVIKD